MLSGPKYTPNQIDVALILLHGYGANGDDLFSLTQVLAPHIKNLAVFAPNAPTQIMYSGYEWFSLDDYFDGDKTDASYLKKLTTRAVPSVNQVKEYIKDIQNTYKIPAEKIIIAGFSQGGLIASFTALTYDESLKGLVIMSGVPLNIADIDVKQTPKVLLTHGQIDPVVPIEALTISQNNFNTLNCATTTKISPNLEHGIDENCIQALIKFMQS